MKLKCVILIILISFCGFSSAQIIELEKIEKLEQKKLHKMVAKEIDELIQKVNKYAKNKEEKLITYSYFALGAPYVFGCLGEGIDGKYDKDPLMDFARYDCMTFCEEMLALVISGSYEETFHNLQKIRYKEGIISFRTGNHYTMVDWLPQNSWLLYDATKEIGGKYCKTLTRTINRHVLLAANKCYNFEGIPGAKKYTINYIPKENLKNVKKLLLGGEIFTVIQNKEGIFAAHMGIVAVNFDRNLVFRHASSAEDTDKVINTLFEDYVNSIQKNDRILGMAFMKFNK